MNEGGSDPFDCAPLRHLSFQPRRPWACGANLGHSDVRFVFCFACQGLSSPRWCDGGRGGGCARSPCWQASPRQQRSSRASDHRRNHCRGPAARCCPAVMGAARPARNRAGVASDFAQVRGLRCSDLIQRRPATVQGRAAAAAATARGAGCWHHETGVARGPGLPNAPIPLPNRSRW